MAFQPTKPLIGNSPEAVWHETNRREILKNRILPSADIFPEETRQGTILRLRQPRGVGGGSSSTAGQFALKDWSYADFLICRELTANPDWDPETDTNRFTEGDTDIYIAKPYLLRRSEFDGLTITVVVETLVAGNIVETDTFWRFTYKSANFRVTEQLASVGGSVLSTENEIVLPRFMEDEIITAYAADNLQMQAFDENITLEANRFSMWAHQFV